MAKQTFQMMGRQFLWLMGQLKRVPWTGWVQRNVKNPDSLLDPMHQMTIVAMVTQDDHLNKMQKP